MNRKEKIVKLLWNNTFEAENEGNDYRSININCGGLLLNYKGQEIVARHRRWFISNINCDITPPQKNKLLD